MFTTLKRMIMKKIFFTFYFTTTNKTDERKTKKNNVWVKKQAYHTSMKSIIHVPCQRISAGLPITSKVVVKVAWPTGLNALHEYVPECSEPASWRISMLIFEVMVFIMNFDEDMRGTSSLYHWSVMGSSPFMTVQGTWRGCPSFTSDGNENGRISGRSV